MTANTEQENSGFTLGTILLDRYKIEKEIGQGGMSRVFLAVDLWGKNNFVIVKIPLAEHLENSWVLKKFQQEAESLARLEHPGIIKLIGHGKWAENFPFLIIEYVPGVTLSKLVNHLTRDFARAAVIIKQIAEAVEHAHSRRIFHRDLKPDNIIVSHAGTPEESIKLIDFGIARVMDSYFINLTRTRYQVGTPFYISPNRIRHDPDDRADDIYALGLIAYEILSGQSPLKGARNFDDLLFLQENLLPPTHYNPQIPPSVESVIKCALELEPSKRQRKIVDLGSNIYELLHAPAAQGAPPVNQTPKSPTGDVTVKMNVEEIVPPTVPKTFKREAAAAASPTTRKVKPVATVREKRNFLTGEQNLLNDDFDAAIVYYNDLIAANPTDSVAYARRALAYLMKGNYEKTFVDCEEAHKIDPRNDFAHLLKAILLRLRGMNKEAQKQLDEALRINPRNIEAALILGDICAQADDHEKAISYYTFICQHHPRFYWAYSNRGNVYFQLNDWEKALKNFSAAIELSPDRFEIYFQRGKTFIKAGQPQQAVEDFTAAIRLAPAKSDIYHARGKAFYQTGNLSGAVEDFNRARQLSAQPAANSGGAGKLSTENNKAMGLTSLMDYFKWTLS